MPRLPGCYAIRSDMDEEIESHPALRGLRTVCRCNNIKHKTIERAIRDGATTIPAVAAKTTATTGQCGGSCTPVVIDMIEEIEDEDGKDNP